MPAVPWRSKAAAVPDQRYLVMASRLPLHSYWRIPGFMRLTLAVTRQLERSDGLVGYSLLAEPTKKTFWTLSAWTGRTELAAFSREMPHLGVMRKLGPHMGATKFITWTVTGADLPIGWDEAIQRLSSTAATPGPSAT